MHVHFCLLIYLFSLSSFIFVFTYLLRNPFCSMIDLPYVCLCSSFSVRQHCQSSAHYFCTLSLLSTPTPHINPIALPEPLSNKRTSRFLHFLKSLGRLRSVLTVCMYICRLHVCIWMDGWRPKQTEAKTNNGLF